MRRRLLRSLLERLFKVEVIGQEECPMMLRWTLLKSPIGKLLIHYFPPHTTDRDPHDHPAPFVTLILAGGYFNTEWENYGGKIVPTVEWLGRGALRYRPAAHMHVTETSEAGTWTVVLMGPKIREWGFLRLTDGKWWDFRSYIERFGGVVRCEPDTSWKAIQERMGTRDATPEEFQAWMDEHGKHIQPADGEG